MQQIAVLSHIVLDEVHRAAGGEPTVEVGGAGAYAAAGASLAGEAGSTMLVSGVGAKDREFLTAWCTDRGIDAGGLFDVSEKSPRTRIRYFDDGEREETPVFGLDHFIAHTPLPRHIPIPPTRVSGVYLFHDHESAYWDEMHRFRENFSGPVLWEVSSDSCHPELRDAVWGRLDEVDILSINRTEAFALLATTDLSDVVRDLGSSPCAVLLRLGAEGSILLENGRRFQVGTAPAAALDPTGGGNSYSGAFLSCFARTGDAIRAARVAAAAASAVVAVVGGPDVDEDARHAVRGVADAVSVSSF